MTAIARPLTSTAPAPVRVLVIDDSAVVRTLLTRELEKASGIEVVGTAPDPYVAREKIAQLRPDVLTLDVEMPRMDGITFLRHLMKSFPVPTIVLSSLTATGTQTAMDALEAGAVEVLVKPGGPYSVGEVAANLALKIRVAARAQVSKLAPQGPRIAAGDAPKSVTSAMSRTTERIIAIGASTGGVQALTEVLTRFPADAPATVIVQHMPASFTASFANRLNTLCRVRVTEAKDGDALVPGTALLAPGDKHMLLRRDGARYRVELKVGPPVYHQRPSVEVLFKSVAKYAGSNAVGCILTGMGADGATGLLEMRQAGARTFAQDEATSVVYGMPMEAMKVGAAERQLPLPDVARELIAAAR